MGGGVILTAYLSNMLTEKQLNNLFVRGDFRLPHTRTHTEGNFTACHTLPQRRAHAACHRQIASNLRVYKKLKNLSRARPGSIMPRPRPVHAAQAAAATWSSAIF